MDTRVGTSTDGWIPNEMAARAPNDAATTDALGQLDHDPSGRVELGAPSGSPVLAGGPPVLEEAFTFRLDDGHGTHTAAGRRGDASNANDPRTP